VAGQWFSPGTLKYCWKWH